MSLKFEYRIIKEPFSQVEAYKILVCPYCGNKMLNWKTEKNPYTGAIVVTCSKCGATDEIEEMEKGYEIASNHDLTGFERVHDLATITHKLYAESLLDAFDDGLNHDFFAVFYILSLICVFSFLWLIGELD